MDLVPLAAHSRGYSCSLRSFFWRAWQLDALSPPGLWGERENHEHPDTHADTHVPCDHFSGGRGTWMRFHRLGDGAKEETMNIREAAAKFKTDEEELFIFRGFAHEAESVLATIHRLALVRVELRLQACGRILRVANVGCSELLTTVGAKRHTGNRANMLHYSYSSFCHDSVSHRPSPSASPVDFEWHH